MSSYFEIPPVDRMPFDPEPPTRRKAMVSAVHLPPGSAIAVQPLPSGLFHGS